jgi:Tfp pilus assembly PilM family ATPase
MALIALKKDKDCLRVAVATSSRASGKVLFDRALSVEMAGETEELSPARLGDKLRAILHAVGVQRGDATVIVARSEVEMRQLELPPVPEEELPDMVRFQARNQFTSYADDFLVDFVPLPGDGEHTRVLAAALSAEALTHIRDTIEHAGLRLRRIVLRPFAAAELIHSGYPDPGCRVILEIIGREADISVVEDDRIVMSRTVRVPDSYTVEKFDAWLPGEIRRTISAAQGQAGAGQIGSIIVCGSAREHEQLCHDLQQSFQIETRFIQPFDLIQKSGRFEQPARHDGFASLVGSLLPVSGDRRSLDFLNPRKKAETRIDRKKIYMAVAVAAAVVLAGILAVWWVLGNKQAQIAALEREIAEIRQFTDITETTRLNTRPLDEWKRRQTDWLEELYQLSLIMPDPDQTRIGRITASSGQADGVSIEIRGLLKEATVRDLKDRLEARPYAVQPSVDPTREGGFDQEYRVELEFPFATVTPHGEVVPFYEQAEPAGDADGSRSDMAESTARQSGGDG